LPPAVAALEPVAAALPVSGPALVEEAVVAQPVWAPSPTALERWERPDSRAVPVRRAGGRSAAPTALPDGSREVAALTAAPSPDGVAGGRAPRGAVPAGAARAAGAAVRRHGRRRPRHRD